MEQREKLEEQEAQEARQVILTVRNHHYAPFGEPLATGEGKYVSYFANQYGEQWLFTYDYAEKRATVAGGEVDWEAYPVTGDEDPEAGELLLDGAEWLWLQACWEATRRHREREAQEA